MTMLEAGRLPAILAACCGAVASCGGRPLPSAGGTDAAISPGDALAADGGPAACTLPSPPSGFSLCGTLDGKSVLYAPPYFEEEARALSEVDFEFLGTDGAWLEAWGAGAWKDTDPHPLTGWLLRPPVDWALGRGWVCGLSGTISHHADKSTDATLGDPAILPACDLAGGPASFNADVTAGVISLPPGGGCDIGFNANGEIFEILAPTCPHVGAPLPLDGLRLVDRGARGATADATACIGTGATITSIPDVDASSADHLLVNIPSMTAPEPCAPAVSGELFMHVGLPANLSDAGPSD
jgi:hypothetical protein